MRRAHVGHRSDHVGGREGPRAPLRLLQPDDPRRAARRRAHAAHDGARRSPRSPASGSGSSARRCGSCRPRSPTTRRSTSTRTSAASRCRATAAIATLLDLVRRARRAAARPRAPAVGVHAHRRARRRPRRAAAEDPPHDHRRRRRLAPLARVRRLRARRARPTDARRRRPSPEARRPGRDTPLQATRSAVVDAPTRNVGAGPARARRRDAGADPSAASSRPAPPTPPGSLGSLQRQVLDTDPARSDVMRDRSLTRHFETYTLSLPAVQGAARKLGGSINDAVRRRRSPARSAATTSASAARSTSCGSRCRSARATAATTPRTASCPARLVVPIQPVDDPRRALRAVRERARRAPRRSRDRRGRRTRGAAHRPPHRVPRGDDAGADRAPTDFAATNLRGSPVPLYIAGARVHRELSVRPAHRHRAERHRAELLRRAAPRAQHRPRRRSPTSTRSWPTSRRRSTPCSAIALSELARYRAPAGPSPSITSSHSAKPGSRHGVCRHRSRGRSRRGAASAPRRRAR